VVTLISLVRWICLPVLINFDHHLLELWWEIFWHTFLRHIVYSSREYQFFIRIYRQHLCYLAHLCWYFDISVSVLDRYYPMFYEIQCVSKGWCWTLAITLPNTNRFQNYSTITALSGLRFVSYQTTTRTSSVHWHFKHTTGRHAIDDATDSVVHWVDVRAVRSGDMCFLL